MAAPRLFPQQQLKPSLQKQDVCERAWAELSHTKSRLTQRQNSTIDFSQHTLPREELPIAPHSPVPHPFLSAALTHSTTAGTRLEPSAPLPEPGGSRAAPAPPGPGSVTGSELPLLAAPGPAPLCSGAPAARARPETAAASTLPSKTRGGGSDKRTPPKAVPPMITIRD